MNLGKNEFKKMNEIQKHLYEKFSEYLDILRFENGVIMSLSDEDKNQISLDIYENDDNLSEEDRKIYSTLKTTNSPFFNSITSGSVARPVYSFCYANENQVILDPYGYIFSYLVSVGKNKLAIGKHHPELDLKVNSIFNRNIETIEECQKCVYSLLCGGGCAMQASYDRSGEEIDFFKPSCKGIKNIIH